MKENQNIFLIGFMGSGKSTIGSKLARSLKKNFFDLDEMIELETGSSIESIFNKHDEHYFRELETRELEKIVNKEDNFIVSTGGGIILKEENWKLMENAGISVYLKSSLENLWSRISSNKSRPLLQVDDPFETAKKIFDERKDLYEQANIVVETDNLGEEEVTNEIIKLLE